MNLRGKVFNYHTKYKEGFLSSEINELLMEFPTVTRQKFSEKLGVVTCRIKDGRSVIYHTDVYVALKCCLGNRNPRHYEID